MKERLKEALFLFALPFLALFVLPFGLLQLTRWKLNHYRVMGLRRLFSYLEH
jgi:hypothetical protein